MTEVWDGYKLLWEKFDLMRWRADITDTDSVFGFSWVFAKCLLMCHKCHSWIKSTCDRAAGGETTSGTDYACRDLDNENQSPNWRSQVIRAAKGEDKRQPWTFAQVSICFGQKICCSKVPPQTIGQEVIHLCLLVRTHWMSTFHNHNEDNWGCQTGRAL